MVIDDRTAIGFVKSYNQAKGYGFLNDVEGIDEDVYILLSFHTR